MYTQKNPTENFMELDGAVVDAILNHLRTEIAERLAGETSSATYEYRAPRMPTFWHKMPAFMKPKFIERYIPTNFASLPADVQRVAETALAASATSYCQRNGLITNYEITQGHLAAMGATVIAWGVN